MLTYELKKRPGVPLYEALYRCIRADILSGKLQPGEKLPSKRSLADNLEVSKITVEGAYNQLLSEGFIRSREKQGYFVEAVERHAAPALPAREMPREKISYPVDFTVNGPARFPFTVWSRLQRQVMLDRGTQLLAPMASFGCLELRQAIAAHLAGFRDLHVHPDQILIGAGTDFLYNLLPQLLGREKRFAVEEPSYQKIRSIYRASGAECMGVSLDENGVRPELLQNADVLHFSPAHHFPTGLVTPIRRRMELLDWAYAKPDRWIVEDDYDSEFRFDSHPVPAMQSLDQQGRVIYMNTFSRSLAPSIRISYMVLPPMLLERFRKEFGFYSCSVSSFEQYTLAEFLSQGYFEKHINRMRKFYRSRRNRVLEELERSPFADRITILEQDAGLHFLARVDTPMPDSELTELCAAAGIRVRCLSEYYFGPVPEASRHCLVINYGGLQEENLPDAMPRLGEAVRQKQLQSGKNVL